MWPCSEHYASVWLLTSTIFTCEPRATNSLYRIKKINVVASSLNTSPFPAVCFNLKQSLDLKHLRLGRSPSVKHLCSGGNSDGSVEILCIAQGPHGTSVLCSGSSPTESDVLHPQPSPEYCVWHIAPSENGSTSFFRIMHPEAIHKSAWKTPYDGMFAGMIPTHLSVHNSRKCAIVWKANLLGCARRRDIGEESTTITLHSCASHSTDRNEIEYESSILYPISYGGWDARHKDRIAAIKVDLALSLPTATAFVGDGTWLKVYCPGGLTPYTMLRSHNTEACPDPLRNHICYLD
jgi:hypothetical protein